MPPSNLPPGVTGGERQVAGEAESYVRARPRYRHCEHCHISHWWQDADKTCPAPCIVKGCIGRRVAKRTGGLW